MIDVIKGLMIPFIGTAGGAACVFLMKNSFNTAAQRILTGFAAGVMVAASIWSLLFPAIEQSCTMARLAFIPSAAGFMIGIFFLLMLDRLIPCIHTAPAGEDSEKRRRLPKNTMLLLAVTLHNIPEGMAVGVVYAGLLYRSSGVTAAGAFALALGIAIQNFPEGAIISLPLRACGMRRIKAFALGTFSGAVEPIAAAITLAAAGLIIPAMPYLLSFAAGAMMYVVVVELIPEMSGSTHSYAGTLSFAGGFVIMMSLDVALS